MARAYAEEGVLVGDVMREMAMKSPNTNITRDVEESSIRVNLNIMQDNLDQLAKVIDRMAHRLNPVLIDNENAMPKDDSVPQPGRCTIANEIGNMRYRIMDMASCLESLTYRLDL